MAMVAESSRAALVIAPHQRANPVDGVAGDDRHLLRGQALRQEPDNLPVAARHGVSRAAIPHRQVVDRDMGSDRESFWHARIIHQDLVLDGHSSRLDSRELQLPQLQQRQEDRPHMERLEQLTTTNQLDKFTSRLENDLKLFRLVEPGTRHLAATCCQEAMPLVVVCGRVVRQDTTPMEVLARLASFFEPFTTCGFEG